MLTSRPMGDNTMTLFFYLINVKSHLIKIVALDQGHVAGPGSSTFPQY